MFFFINLIKTRKKLIPILTIDTDMYRKYRKSDPTLNGNLILMKVRYIIYPNCIKKCVLFSTSTGRIIVIMYIFVTCSKNSNNCEKNKRGQFS